MNELLTPRTPGAALRMAREKRRLSIADVVEATRIKPHIIAALESDDYSVIPAPLYGKGFIKLYAEHVGLDPVPLINHYLSNYARTTRPTLKTELPPPSAIHDGLPWRECGSGFNQLHERCPVNGLFRSRRRMRSRCRLDAMRLSGLPPWW